MFPSARALKLNQQYVCEHASNVLCVCGVYENGYDYYWHHNSHSYHRLLMCFSFEHSDILLLIMLTWRHRSNEWHQALNTASHKSGFLSGQHVSTSTRTLHTTKIWFKMVVFNEYPCFRRWVASIDKCIAHFSQIKSRDLCLFNISLFKVHNVCYYVIRRSNFTKVKFSVLTNTFVYVPVKLKYHMLFLSELH